MDKLPFVRYLIRSANSKHFCWTKTSKHDPHSRWPPIHGACRGNCMLKQKGKTAHSLPHLKTHRKVRCATARKARRSKRGRLSRAKRHIAVGTGGDGGRSRRIEFSEPNTHRCCCCCCCWTTHGHIASTATTSVCICGEIS